MNPEETITYWRDRFNQARDNEIKAQVIIQDLTDANRHKDNRIKELETDRIKIL